MVEGIMNVLELLPKFCNLIADIFPLDQALFEKICDNPHLRLLHTESIHLLDPQTNSGRIGYLIQWFEGKKVHIQDDIVILQMAGHLVSTPDLRNIYGQLVGLRKAESGGLDFETHLI